MNHACPVCGWPELREPPRNEEGGASYEICPCCGFEFGFDDDSEGLSYAMARARWREAGMPWWSAARPAPAHWDAARQLARAGLA